MGQHQWPTWNRESKTKILCEHHHEDCTVDYSGLLGGSG